MWRENRNIEEEKKGEDRALGYESQAKVQRPAQRWRNCGQRARSPGQCGALQGREERAPKGGRGESGQPRPCAEGSHR